MRLLIAAGLAAFALLQAAPAEAQGYRAPDLAAQRAAIERLAPLVGVWQGVAEVASPNRATVHQTERVERAHDGLLILFNGAGYRTAARTGDPVFRAFGVLSYNDVHRVYELRSYALGHAVTARGEFLPDGAFRWSFAPGGPVQVRYTIWVNGTAWRETGEMSYDNGQTWTQTLEMNLTRVP